MSEIFYAVAKGREPGIYSTWPQCRDQVNGFDNARYKKFTSRTEAEKFIEDNKNFSGFSKSSSQKRPSSKYSKKDGASREEDRAPDLKRFKTADERGWKAAGSNEKGYEDTVIVYTDGAASNNGRHSAKAAIGVYWGENHKDNVSERVKGRQTNNVAEIQAAIRAIRQAKERGYSSVTIRTDSKFMLQSINEWVPRWQKNGWKTSTGGVVQNREDFVELVEVMKGCEVRWEKVRAHCGEPGNEMADTLARNGLSKDIPTD